MIWSGCCSVEGRGPPGLNWEDTPDVRHGSNSPLVQINRVELTRFQPCVFALAAAVLTAGLALPYAVAIEADVVEVPGHSGPAGRAQFINNFMRHVSSHVHGDEEHDSYGLREYRTLHPREEYRILIRQIHRSRDDLSPLPAG